MTGTRLSIAILSLAAALVAVAAGGAAPSWGAVLAPRSVHALTPAALVDVDHAGLAEQLQLTRSEDRVERLRGVARVGRWPDADATRALWADLRQRDDELGLQATFSQGVAMCRSHVGCLAWCQAALSDEQARVRAIAVDLLAREASDEARAVLMAHLDDDASVRRRIERRLASWTWRGGRQARSVRRSNTLPAAPAR